MNTNNRPYLQLCMSWSKMLHSDDTQDDQRDFPVDADKQSILLIQPQGWFIDWIASQTSWFGHGLYSMSFENILYLNTVNKVPLKESNNICTVISVIECSKSFQNTNIHIVFEKFLCFNIKLKTRIRFFNTYYLIISAICIHFHT